MTFECYVCKAEVEGGYHVFMKTRNAREKDNFRDVCENCMATLLEATGDGYAVLDEPRAEVPGNELVAMFREAMNILPGKVRRGIYSPFWEKCQELLDRQS